jgi:hypothetical protein
MPTKSDLPPDLSRNRMVSLPQAAELRGVSVDTLKRRFPHLIKRVSPRRLAVRVGDLLDEPPSQPLAGAQPFEPQSAA